MSGTEGNCTLCEFKKTYIHTYIKLDFISKIFMDCENIIHGPIYGYL
jgi:hypothetical protein